MTVSYQLRTYTPAGVLTGIITDFLDLSYKAEVNSPGQLLFKLPAGHRAIKTFVLDAQIEVWRSDLAGGIPWYCDFYAFWRGEQRTASSDGITTYTAICVGQLDLLRRSVVAYPANTANRNTYTSTSAESIAKTLVTYNATSAGTTGDGRKRNVTTVGVSVESDAAGGNTIDFTCTWQNLLAALQEVASIGGGDYELHKTAARAWQFRWRNGQLGTDRSASVSFALQYGNMANPQLVRDSTTEKTVAIVGGQGEESDRTIVVRTGANYDAEENAIECFVDARQLTVTDSLNARGDAELANTRQRNKLTFDVLQIPSTRYGEHYFLGDLVTGYYEGITSVQKIKRVTVSLTAQGNESIKVELEDV